MQSHQWYLAEQPLSTFFKQTKEQEEKIQENKYLQYITASQSKIQKSKSKKKILLLNSFEEDEKGLLIKILAKFAIILNVDITNQNWFKKLSQKQINQIHSIDHEVLYAGTTKSQYFQYFYKSFEPKLGLKHAQLSPKGIFVVVENRNHQTLKSKIKVLNHQNLLHSIVNNIKQNQGIKPIYKWKQIQSIVCFQKLGNRQISQQILKQLLSRYEQFVYVAVAQQCNIFLGNFNSQRAIICGKSMHLVFNQSFCAFGSKALNKKAIEFMLGLYQRYTKIDNIIYRQIEKSQIRKNIFNKNKFCMKLYGIYYSYISLNQLEDSQELNQIQNSFLQQIIKLKQQQQQQDVAAKNQKQIQKPTSHIITNAKKGKPCIVCCQKGNRVTKTKYSCPKCSETYGRQIFVCATHFRQFHLNMDQFMIKGQIKRANSKLIKNELQQLDKQKQVQVQKGAQEKIIEKDAKYYSKQATNILKKWNEKSQHIGYWMNTYFASLKNSNVPPVKYQQSFLINNSMLPNVNQSYKVQQQPQQIIMTQNQQLEKQQPQKQAKKSDESKNKTQKP